MATQTSSLTFTGRFGNIIGYRRGRKHFFRSIPNAVQQTVGTKRAAQRFGAASRKARLIRSAFSAELDICADGSHVNRLNKTMIQAGRDNPKAIAGFQFNQFTGTDHFFPVTPVFSQDGKLHIPAQQLRQLKGIQSWEVKVIATRIQFKERRVTGTDSATIHIDPSKPFEGATLEVDVPGKGMLMIVLQVRGFYNGVPSGNRKHQAADIIAIVDEKTKEVFQKQEHPQSKYWRERFQSAIPQIAATVQRE